MARRRTMGPCIRFPVGKALLLRGPRSPSGGRRAALRGRGAPRGSRVPDVAALARSSRGAPPGHGDLARGLTEDRAFDAAVFPLFFQQIETQLIRRVRVVRQVRVPQRRSWDLGVAMLMPGPQWGRRCGRSS